MIIFKIKYFFSNEIKRRTGGFSRKQGYLRKATPRHPASTSDARIT